MIALREVLRYDSGMFTLAFLAGSIANFMILAPLAYTMEHAAGIKSFWIRIALAVPYVVLIRLLCDL